jgi:glycosyltransferase involved in cell wall biosynthesis
MAKILILANHGFGLYLFRKELISKLTVENAVYVSLPGDRYVPQLEDLGCIHIDTPVGRRGTNPVTDIMLLLRYLKLIRTVKPDLVLTYTIKPNVYGGIACRVFKVPYIATITGMGTAIDNTNIIKKVVLKLYRIGLKKAQCVFFQNKRNQRYFLERKLLSGKSRLVPGSGVNLNYHSFSEYPNANKEISFLYIGRIMKEKGIEELFAAAAEIKKSYANVCFNLVGILEEDYSQQIAALEKESVLKFYGQQDDVRIYLRNCHAVVLPSYHEGTSNVLLEAAATGRPVLASRINGCLETFEEGLSGLGFEAKNVSSLVAALFKFIELPHRLKEKMGQAGRCKMEQEYNRNIVVEAYLEEILLVVNPL